MRAVIVTDDQRLGVTELPDPEPGPGEVVVRVAACGICGSDLTVMRNRAMPAGVVLGHEASGRVESVGEGVARVRPGDHVSINPFDPCGECEPCRSGADQRCVHNAFTTIGLGTRPGAYADLIGLSEQMVVPMPGEVPVERGAIAEPLAVALHGFGRSSFEPGMTVGVIGCGPIGLSAVLCARTLGAGHVWASDPNEFRAELASRVGADESGTSPKDADLVVECAGAKGTVDLAVSSVRGGGEVVLLAVNVTGDNVYPFTWVTKEATIVPSLGYTRAEHAEATAWIASGRVDVAPMITRRVPLEATDEALFALLDGANEGKVLVTP